MKTLCFCEVEQSTRQLSFSFFLVKCFFTAVISESLPLPILVFILNCNTHILSSDQQ